MKAPQKALLMVTERCNSRCSYCGLWQNNKNTEAGEFTVREMEEVLPALHKLGVKKIAISGGEPLIRQDLEDIISLCGRTMNVFLITNGMLLTMDRMEKLLKAGLRNISLSLDTLDAGIYEKLRGVPFHFAERACETLRNAKKQNPALNIALNCVVSKYNIGRLENYAKEILYRFQDIVGMAFQAYMITNRGFRDDDLLPDPDAYPAFKAEMQKIIRLKHQGFPIVNADEFLKSFPDYLIFNRMGKRPKCIAGGVITINEKLELCPCEFMPAAGSLRQHSVIDLWHSEKMRRIQNGITHGQCPGCLCSTYKDRTLSRFDKAGLWVRRMLHSKQDMLIKAGCHGGEDREV